MKRAIITGACGYLGSRLAKAMIDRGIMVYAFDCINEIDIRHELLKYYICDIEKNIFPIKDHLEDSDFLFHFAWNGVHSDFRNDYYRQSGNIFSLINILSIAKNLKVKKTIIPGSASEYASSTMPITGNNKPAPVDAYGAIKSSCHLISNLWSIENNLPLIWIVPSSIYGPGRNDNNILTYAIKTLLKGDKPLFTPLEQRWDYIFIDDYIEALLLVADKGITGKNYTIGYGAARELRDYVFIIKDIINSSLCLGIGEKPYKGKKPDNSEMDISELINDTGFRPLVKFEDGIRRTIEWIKMNE